jgi:hypothetical protein
MATTRTPINRPTKARITPEIVELYKKIRDADDAVDTRRDRVALHTKLGRRVWEYSIEGIDPDAVAPPDWVVRQGDFRIQDWTTARDLLLALEAAADETLSR